MGRAPEGSELFEIEVPEFYHPGERINITLHSISDNDITGWLLHSTNDVSGMRAGAFEAVANTRAMGECEGDVGSSFTHTGTAGWGRTQTFVWTAPESEDPITFGGLGVQSGGTWQFVAGKTVSPAQDEEDMVKLKLKQTKVNGDEYTYKVKIHNLTPMPLEGLVASFKAEGDVTIIQFPEGCVQDGNKEKYYCDLPTIEVEDKVVGKFRVSAAGDGLVKAKIHYNGDTIAKKKDTITM